LSGGRRPAQIVDFGLLPSLRANVAVGAWLFRVGGVLHVLRLMQTAKTR
jgi:hypothetical protein